MEFGLPLCEGVTMKLLSLLLVSIIFGQSLWAKDSIYEIEGKWKNVDSESVSVGVAKGSYAVIAMVYTSCAYACPMTISKLQDIEKSFKKAGIVDVQFVLASFDVKKDTPEALKKFQTKRKLDPNKWVFLSPHSDTDARELAVVLGISYKEIDGGDFSHSNAISLLDKNGAILSTLPGLNSDHKVFIEVIQKNQKK